MQLRYYEGKAEDNPKDVIELKDVLAVTPMKYVPGAAKKADENAFFEVTLVAVILAVLEKLMNTSTGHSVEHILVWCCPLANNSKVLKLRILL